LYVVEELVTQSGQQRWAQSIALEVISSRRVAVARSASAAKAGIL